MIEFLSDPSWIHPQTDFLLFLQNIRTSVPEAVDKIFLSITIFGEFWLPTLLCATVYWCIDFHAGIYLFSLEGINSLFAHLFKMIACVYRPWILDNRIHPSKLAIPYAKGYSFPSGHSFMSSSVFGGIAYLNKKNKLTVTLLILLILLVGFSRLWLGVHTPQDVLCGLLTGCILVFALKPLIDWAEKKENRYLYLLGIINTLAILALIYVYFFNTYRMDYVSGKLLVDPERLKYNTAVVYAYSLGLINGCYLCRTFIPFNPKDVSVKKRIIRGIIGAAGTILLLKYVLEIIIMNQMHFIIAVIPMFIVGFTITFIYPFIFTKLINKNI